MPVFDYSKKKFRIVLLGTIFLFSFVLNQIFPEKVSAQLLDAAGGGLTMDAAFMAAPSGIPVDDKGMKLQLKMDKTQEKVEKSIGKSIYAAVLSSAVQGVSYMTRKIAYDTARYVAYGGKGQGALIFKDGWGPYMAKVSGDAVGAAVSELSKWAGLDLCHFPNLNLDLYLELNLRQKDIPTTDCTWSDLTSAYGKEAWKKRYENAVNTADRFSSQDKLLKEFGKAVRPANTDFGIGVGAMLTVDRMKVQKEKSAELARQEGNGFKDLADLISGNIKTPADVIAEETKTQLSESHQQALTYGQLTGVYASGAYEIIPQTASMFLNTLGATLIQRLFSQGLTSSGGDDSLAYDYGSDPSVANSAEAAGNAFNFLFARTPTQATDYNNIAEFVACPDNPGINNCVMDSGLQEALARSSSENPMTIAEAIKQGGLLNPNWPLISPRRVQDTQNIKGCVSEKYCYSNIQKLRKARILPLGFEIAALRSDPDNPWTLGQVVAGFDDCRRDHPENPEIVTPDPAHPFCHLINPNWVLKAPSARCEIKSFGDALIDPASATRREECVDVSTCLSRDNTGACAQYGYCTKENNTWHMGADACPAQFNTCTTYTNLETRKVVSYLAKTVDYGECTADNVGCRAYSLTGIGNLNLSTTTWKNSAVAGTNEVVYFNEKIKNLSSMCSSSNDGCNAFYAAVRLPDGRYLDSDTTTPAIDFVINKDAVQPIQKAPDYLGCYDADKSANAPGIQWPTTLVQAETAANSAKACNTFASACIAEEVGCEAFKPVDSGPIIPGKIGDSNYCDQSCVGYETFKQEPAPFEEFKFPVYFIPSQAKECPAVAAGCSQFTNIDAQSKGGEGIEYYTDLKYCEKPNNDAVRPNIKTFYSWEGSADNGYVLRTYQMKPLDASINGRVGFERGSPAYILDTNDALNEFIGKCNKVNYEALLANPNDPAGADPDCRALFDNDGHTYYRLLAKTVTVDEACHPLRKTEPVFVVDPDLNSLDACHNKNARWNTSVPAAPFCERCINGGKYEEGKGFCVYQTISKPSESTSCAPEFNGCRAYTGNAVSNIQDVFIPAVDNFEPFGQNPDAFVQAASAWKLLNNNPAQISNESVRTGEHSLQALNGVSRQIPSSTMETGAWYDISFLAKSNDQNTALVVLFNSNNQFVGGFAPAERPLNIGSQWQLYHLGPVQFTGSTEGEVKLFFGVVGVDRNNFFLDQVRLRQINDYKHYIKDSWKAAVGNNGNDVPLICDSAPEDSLPGEALGCRQYNDSADNARYTTGFQNLCRERAIACQPVWDTYNTVNGSDAEQAQLFNVICTGLENASCTAMYEERELAKCFIAPGQKFCYIPQITLPVGKTFSDLESANPSLLPRVVGSRLTLSNSSISIPKDTPTSTPLFLAVGEATKGKQKFICDESALGCQRVGQEERHLPNTSSTSFTFNEFYLKNDPESYKDTLCHDTLVGCSHYQNGSRETFFRDPQITGESLCVYKPQSDGLSSQYGWYLKGVGKCTTALDPQVVGDQLCRTDNDCPLVGANQQRCVNIESVACSPDNVRVGGFNDIWSNKSPSYRGNVGICPAENNTCTEIIDRQDTSNINPDGKPYYVLFNDKIEEKKKQCSQVSLADGCVLFDKTDEPNKVFDSAATYLKSQKRPDKPYGSVDAVRKGDAGFNVADTNLLMKVNRDRECTEWLACKSYASAVSYEGGARHETQICAQLASCDQIGVGGTCSHWVDARKVEGDAALSRLTYDKYVSRPVSWHSSEMSGYSLYNKFQIGDMIYLKFNFPKDLQAAMADEMNQTYIARQLRQNIFDVLGQTDFDCKPSNAQENTDWNMCGFGDNGINGGRCYANRCMYPINGSFPTTIKVNTNPPLSASQKAPLLKQLLSFLKPNSCKGVPESDSPYSNKILKVGEGEQKLVNSEAPGERTNTAFKLEGFSSANVCQTGACSCAYQKVQYGGSTQQDYWPLYGLKQGVSIPEGICVGGGIKEQRPCTKSSNCIDNKGTATVEDDEFGVCALRSNSETRIGLEGYCLEEDRSRPIFYNGQNSFACLTWLPVNISASAVDIYNTDVSAGYNLKDDAEPAGGQVYCSNSTATGLGMYDQKFTGILQPDNTRRAVTTDELTNIYNAYFEADGSPNFFGAFAMPGALGGFSCGGLGFLGEGAPAYYRAICEDNTEASHDLARAVTAWLYKQKIYNSTLLRLEYGLVGDPGQEKHHWGNWGNDMTGVDDEDSVRKIFSFAPLNQGVDSGDKIREFGTIMHIPRTFSDGVIQEDSVYAAQMDIINPPETVGKGQDARVQAGAYGVYPESAARGGRVYRSSFERYMRENDLAAVHFLPLSYPGGVDSEAPTLMEKDYAINFDRLRTPGRNPAEAILLLDSDANNKQFALPRTNRDTVLWTYKLDNLSQSAFAFRDYSHFNQSAVLQSYIGPDTATGERNRIQTRYVAVYSDWVASGDNDETPNFLQQHVPIDQGEIPGILAEEVTPASPSSDPFSAPCVDKQGNWLAIGMDFNKDGEFLGYIARFCQQAGGEDDLGIQFAVAAQLHDRCTTFEQVYKADGVNPLYDTTNKARTNLVWYGSKTSDGLGPRSMNFGSPWSSIPLDRFQRPYASLQLTEQDLFNRNKLRNYTFRYKEQGLPFLCSASWLGAINIETTKRCESMMLIPLDRGFVNQMNALSNPRVPDRQGPPPPLPPDWEVGDPDPREAEAFDSSVGSKQIQRLFAQIWSVSTIDSRFYTDIRRDGFTSNFDFFTATSTESDGIDVSGESAAPPKIYALNPSRCEDRDKCSAAEAGNITIGNRNGTRVDYNGDGIPDEPDVDQNGVTDPIIIPGGSYSAEAKFFAFADDNHMPIRRMMVDWDEEGLPPMNVDKRGLYKNRKPVCGTSNQGGRADVGICATMIPPAIGNNAPTFRSTGVTCSLDKPCSGNTFCMPASGAPSTLKVCEGLNAGGDITYSSRACGEDRDCAGLPDFPTCSGSLPMSDLQSGVLGPEYKTMRFGNTPRACTTDYFTFVHQYSCGESNIGTKNAVYVRDLNTNNNPYKDGSFTAGIVSELKNKYRLRDDDYVCIFKPKVQAMDNWDWCNGSCKKEYNAAGDPIGNQTNGCYDPLSNGIVSAQQCSNTDDRKAQGIYPWSDYRGVIIVIPDIDR